MILPGIFKNTTIRNKRAFLYYMGALNFMFVYTTLAYSIAIFLTERFPDTPNAIFLVGIILGCASFFGLFIDTILAYLQKVFTPKKLILSAIVGVFITVGIFFTSHFFSSFGLFIFTIIAAFAYGWSYDLYDITMTTIIFKRSKENQYAQNLSQKKTFEAIGMLCGVLVGGISITLGSLFAQTLLLIFLTFLFIFFKKKFDNQEDENISLEFADHTLVNWKKVLSSLHNPDDITHLLQNAQAGIKEKVMHISKATTAEIKRIPENTEKAKTHSKKILEEARLVLLDLLAKENELVQKKKPRPKLNIKDIKEDVALSFAAFTSIFKNDSRFALIWVALIVMFFSFWDTMAVTFQPIFINQFSDQLGFLTAFIMPVFILPIFFLQVPFAQISDKIGHQIMVLIGVFISSLSLLCLGLLESVFGGSILVLLLAGIGNSIGYAAAFTPAQAKLTAELQYKMEQKGIHMKSDDAAAPMRITLNIGNILGQLCGGAIFAFLGFLNGFLMFGVFLFVLSVFSLIFIPKLKIPKSVLS